MSNYQQAQAQTHTHTYLYTVVALSIAAVELSFHFLRTQPIPLAYSDVGDFGTGGRETPPHTFSAFWL